MEPLLVCVLLAAIALCVFARVTRTPLQALPLWTPARGRTVTGALTFGVVVVAVLGFFSPITGDDFADAEHALGVMLGGAVIAAAVDAMHEVLRGDRS